MSGSLEEFRGEEVGYEGDGALEVVEGDPRDWDDPRPAWEPDDE